MQHPNADRLSVCQVDDGTNHHRQIVCGAKNYKVGDKVPVALPGRRRCRTASRSRWANCAASNRRECFAVRASWSCPTRAMACSFFRRRRRSARRSVRSFPLIPILDVEITPNRGDLLSYLGLAREIAALSGEAGADAANRGAQDRKRSSVKIAALRECPFYSARRIENMTVGPSPDWLRAKLEAAACARSTTSWTSPTS